MDGARMRGGVGVGGTQADLKWLWKEGKRVCERFETPAREPRVPLAWSIQCRTRATSPVLKTPAGKGAVQRIGDDVYGDTIQSRRTRAERLRELRF